MLASRDISSYIVCKSHEHPSERRWFTWQPRRRL